jgi:hypothetical protein
MGRDAQGNRQVGNRPFLMAKWKIFFQQKLAQAREGILPPDAQKSARIQNFIMQKRNF